jgi:L-lactate permease
MQWQDWVFSLGGFLILVSLVPTLRGAQKPALSTGLMSFVLVAIFAGAMVTLGLWLSAFANALISLSWGFLALQRWQADRASRTEAVETDPESALVVHTAGLVAAASASDGAS